jgi:hypothetical protein
VLKLRLLAEAITQDIAACLGVALIQPRQAELLASRGCLLVNFAWQPTDRRTCQVRTITAASRSALLG